MSTDSRLDTEVLEPLLLMSASATDCALTRCAVPDDLAGRNRQHTEHAFNDCSDSEGENPEESVFVVVKSGEGPAWCRGDRSDFTVEDHGFGIYGVRNRNRVEFVTDINEIQFYDGTFRISDLVTRVSAPDEGPADDDGSIPPIETELALDDDRSDAGELLTADVWFPDSEGSSENVRTDDVGDSDSGIVMAEGCLVADPVSNQEPQAQDDSNSTTQDVSVSRTAAINDSDVDSDAESDAESDGDSLMFFIKQGPEHGTIDMAQNGSYTHTLDPGFSEQDTFCCEVSDENEKTSVTEVCILVMPQQNQASEAVDDQFTTDENQAVEGNVLTNDFDADGDALTASPLTDIQTFEGGIVTLHRDGSFVYMPADSFCGVDTFRYCMSDDSGDTATATVRITVNDVPESPQADSFGGDTGDHIKGNVTLNDGISVDPEFVQLVKGPEHGTLKLNPDGTFCYTADDGFCGEDTFSYVITRACQTTEAAVVRLVVADVQYDTTYESAGNGRVWGDPHFEGDDGGLYDVQGEAGHVYNILSDRDLQVNAAYISGDLHPGSTMIGEIGATVGSDQVHADMVGTRVNGDWLQAGEARSIEGGTVEFDGEYTTLTTGEYRLRFHKHDGWMDVKLDALDPFSDRIAPHGLWGRTVDGDTAARNGDFFRTNGFDDTLQGGGAIDTVDAGSRVIVSETGDRNAFRLCETEHLFSTSALLADGGVFFRFHAGRGTGLARVSRQRLSAYERPLGDAYIDVFGKLTPCGQVSISRHGE